MTQEERAKYATSYALELGPGYYKGCRNMYLLLGEYVKSGLSAHEVNYKKLIETVAKERDVSTETTKKAIHRYVKGGLKSYHDSWVLYTGWDKDVPPDVDTAIKLICMSLDNYIEIIEKNQKNN